MAFCAVVTLVATTAGCGLFGGSARDDAAARPEVEKARIEVGIIPSTEMAPLWVAQEKGYFAEEGLDVELVPLDGGGAAMTSLIGGDVDISFASYPLLVQAQQKSRGDVDVKIVSDASAARPDTTAVVVTKDSPLRGAKDLADKKIAVPATGSMADLAVLAGMKAAKAATAGVDWQVMNFPDMLPNLRSGAVDAAFLVEPYLSVAQAQLGVWTVFEPMVGRLEGIALNGYAALAETTTAYPKTVAAFQRAVLRAHRAATTPEGQAAIRLALIEQAEVRPEIAPVLHLPAYPLTTDPTRLQRVPDLLREFGLIADTFDIKPMIVSG